MIIMMVEMKIIVMMIILIIIMMKKHTMTCFPNQIWGVLFDRKRAEKSIGRNAPKKALLFWG